MNRQSILLVSDIDPQIFSLSQLLTENKYRVKVAKTADDALHLLQVDPHIGLVICDLAIRKTDAVALMASVLKINYSTDEGILPAAKIIALTTPNPGDSKAAEQIQREINVYTSRNVLSKPVDPGALLDRVESLIGPSDDLAYLDAESAPNSASRDRPQRKSIHDQFQEINQKIIRLDEKHDEIEGKTRNLEGRIVRLESAIFSYENSEPAL